jgi:formamidopyrimidine-DNA glycosylase
MAALADGQLLPLLPRREDHALPELPEAETIARALRAEMIGWQVAAVRLRRRDILRGTRGSLSRLLTGATVSDIGRQGKRVILGFEPAGSLVVRLGMTGRLSLVASDQPSDRHTHLRISFADQGWELRFRDARRFGNLTWACGGPDATAEAVGTLGPEPWDLSPAQFIQRLQRRRPIKSLLLDQQIIAGLGNIYCDESLFAAGIDPRRIAREISEPEARRLLRAIKATLRRAIRFGGTTFLDYQAPRGEAGAFADLLNVYQKQDQPCRICQTPIERVVIIGRSTFFCPCCQGAT